LLAAILALISLLAYSQFFGIELMEFDAVPKFAFFNEPNAGHALKIFTQSDSPLAYAAWYRPIPSFIWWSIFLFRGIDFQTFHAFNFVLHALNTVLVFLLAKKLVGGKSAFFPFLAALVFALHPINLNVVLFVSRLPEMMVAFSLLASLLSLIAFFEGRGNRFYLLSIAFCFLGIFSKEAGSLIPFALFFYCIAFLKEKNIPKLISKALMICLPFFSLIVIYAALMIFALGKFPGYGLDFNYSSSQLAFSFFTHLFLPIGCFTRIFNTIQPILWQPIINILLSITIIAFALTILKFFSKEEQNKPALFLSYWLFLFLFAFVAFGFLPPWYAYIPLIPFCLLLIFLLKKHAKKSRKSSQSLVIAIMLSLLFLSFIALSPLVVSYRQPIIAGKLTQTILSQTQAIADSLPGQSRLYLVNYPRIMQTKENGFRHAIILVNEESVQEWLNLKLPEKNLKVIPLVSVVLFTYPLGETQFAFSQKENGLFLLENLDTSSAKISISLPPAPKKANETGIIINYNNGKTSETIELGLPNKIQENSFFLFFDGKQIQVIKTNKTE